MIDKKGNIEMYKFNKNESYCYCKGQRLETLKGCNREYVLFDCSYNCLTDLKGAPEKVWDWFICNNNNLTSLKGGPKSCDLFNCSDNMYLTDISDLAPNVRCVNIYNSPNIEVFTKEINNKSGLLEIGVNINHKDLIQRIKEWPYYDVMYEQEPMASKQYIYVKMRNDNEIFMDQL